MWEGSLLQWEFRRSKTLGRRKFGNRFLSHAAYRRVGNHRHLGAVTYTMGVRQRNPSPSTYHQGFFEKKKKWSQCLCSSDKKAITLWLPHEMTVHSTLVLHSRVSPCVIDLVSSELYNYITNPPYLWDTTSNYFTGTKPEKCSPPESNLSIKASFWIKYEKENWGNGNWSLKDSIVRNRYSRIQDTILQLGLYTAWNRKGRVNSWITHTVTIAWLIVEKTSRWIFNWLFVFWNPFTT